VNQLSILKSFFYLGDMLNCGGGAGTASGVPGRHSGS
jgi:hypothetical protein